MEISHNIMNLFGLELDLWIVIMSLVSSVILIVFAWFASRKINWIPCGMQNVMEYLIEFVQGLVQNALGEKGLKYTYFFGSLFLFILVSNMLGLVPGFSSPTKDISINASLAIAWLVFAQYIAIKENGLKGYFKHYFVPFPPYVVIHLLEMGIRPLTLTMRLFANIMAGEIMLEKLTQYFPILVPSVWIAISLIIGGIQAFIFTILTVSYTGLSVSHEDNSHSDSSHAGANEHAN
jgi:F-type H+-transporting ATPase subunit a